MPYLRWQPSEPDGRLEGGPVFPAAAPGWVHMPARAGRIWARGPESVPAGVAFEEVRGRYAFAGPCLAHFGHMLGEFVHRLWVLRDDPDLVPLLVATRQQGAGIPGFLAEWLRLVGARPPLLVDRPMRLEEVVVGEPGRVLGTATSAEYGAVLGGMLPPALLAPSGGASRLAIMRGHLQTGRCVGEAWIESFLATQGYRIFRPEAHSLAEQIAALAAADRIVMSEGSAMHLFDVLPPIRAEVAVLVRRPGSGMAGHCLATKVRRLAQFRPHFIIGTLDATHPRANAITGVEPRDFLVHLAEEGFIEAVPEERFLDEPGLLEADLAAYAAGWRSRRSPMPPGDFVTRAAASCRAGRMDPLLRATLDGSAGRR
ncbi:glycosyltransferase family 61 protein [Roseomonas eburnea]|uniref:Glycosyltransferase family 61 protein n=1 Tax=Neoroseomonas eburnea TaxID=1346889 RepID=A0A9X9X5L6_9PROT|nr:glycosyltransferase 61 family protein [Neoroseomonas eburnea]MBR0679002.1 glycosyltransferase family 61 protein [Neoroseomonas eburnea]